MVEQVRGMRDNLLDWRQKTVFRDALGMVDAAELETSLESKSFKPYFEHYMEQHVWLEQKATHALGRTRRRGVDLATVEQRLLEGEGPHRGEYSNAYTDRSNWD